MYKGKIEKRKQRSAWEWLIDDAGWLFKAINSIKYIKKCYSPTRFIVSFTDGNGSRGKDPWKLYSIGLCQPKNNFTVEVQILVIFEILDPFSLDSYIHPLYIRNNFKVYRITYITVNHKSSPTTNDPAMCAIIEDLLI